MENMRKFNPNRKTDEDFFILFNYSNIEEIDDLICPSYTFNLQSFRLQPIFTNNCHPKTVLNETKRKMNIPDDNVVSLFEPAAADEEVLDDDDDDAVSACIHGGPCIIEPSGGWSHWSKARASLTCDCCCCCCCCDGWIIGFFIWAFDGDIICCWSSFPFVDGVDNFRFAVEFSVFNFDKPLLRWCRGDSVATVFGGGWLK